MILLREHLLELHEDRGCWGLQLLVQQSEHHGALVALRRLSQGAVELRLEVVDVPKTLLTVQLGEIGRRLIEAVDSQSC